MKYLFKGLIFKSIQDICTYITDNGNSTDGRFELAMFDAITFEEETTTEEWNKAFIKHFGVQVVEEFNPKKETLQIKFDNPNGVFIGTIGFINYDNGQLYDEFVYIFQKYGYRDFLEHFGTNITIKHNEFADEIKNLIIEWGN